MEHFRWEFFEALELEKLLVRIPADYSKKLAADLVMDHMECTFAGEEVACTWEGSIGRAAAQGTLEAGGHRTEAAVAAPS